MTIRIPRWPLIVIAALLVLAGVGFGFYRLGRSSIDQDKIEQAAFDEGKSEGRAAGFKAGKRAGMPAFSYDDGYSDGYDEGFKDGGNSAIPDDIDLGRNYIVDFVPGSHGVRAVVDYYLEMPLGTTWQCGELGTCRELTDIPTLPP